MHLKALESYPRQADSDRESTPASREEPSVKFLFA